MRNQPYQNPANPYSQNPMAHHTSHPQNLPTLSRTTLRQPQTNHLTYQTAYPPSTYLTNAHPTTIHPQVQPSLQNRMINPTTQQHIMPISQSQQSHVEHSQITQQTQSIQHSQVVQREPVQTQAVQNTQPVRKAPQVLQLTEQNLEEEIERNQNEMRKMKTFVEKIVHYRNELEDFLKSCWKHSEKETSTLPKSKEEYISYFGQFLREFEKSSIVLLKDVTLFQEEGELTLSKDHAKLIEADVNRVRKRETIESFSKDFEKMRMYFVNVCPSLQEFINRTKTMNYLPLIKLTVEKLKGTIKKVVSKGNLVVFCFDTEGVFQFKTLDDMFYICVVQPDLMTITLCFKKLAEPADSVILHSFALSVLFEGGSALKGLRNKASRKHFVPEYRDCCPEPTSEEEKRARDNYERLREVVMMNYSEVELPCLYPKTKLLQFLTNALNSKYLTYNETTYLWNYAREEPLFTVIDESLKFCTNLMNQKCAVCNEKIQLDFKDILLPIQIKDKTEKYCHTGCWKSNLRLMTSTPLTVEIPLEEQFVDMCGDDDMLTINDL